MAPPRSSCVRTMGMPVSSGVWSARLTTTKLKITEPRARRHLVEWTSSGSPIKLPDRRVTTSMGSSLALTSIYHGSGPHGPASCGVPERILAERFMDKPAPEPLSQAAMEVLSVVAYEQPITRAEISHIRGTDSSGAIETLLARRPIEDDPRFGGRGHPSFLARTADFLRSLGLGSLAELPPRLV